MVKLSVIIPALNEEETLPALLESLDGQTFMDFETIVADADSNDATVEISERHGAHVVKGGMPAVGRNAGAGTAEGDFLIFLDADVRVPKAFLEDIYNGMQRRYADLATCETRPISNVAMDQLLFDLSNSVIRYTARTQPRAMGFCTFVTKRLFDHVGGFDETITLGEDHEFVKRASVVRPLHFLDRPYVEVSVRRMEKEGRLGYTIKALHSDLYRNIFGEIRNNEVEYEFGDFTKHDNAGKRSVVEKLDNLLLDLDAGFNRLAGRLSQDTVDDDGGPEVRRSLRRTIQLQIDQLKERLRE